MIAYSGLVLEKSGSFFDWGLNIIFTCAWVLFVLLFFVYFYTSHQKEKYRLSAELNEKMIQSQQQYYQMQLENEKKIQSFRHDYNNHIMCIKMFAQKKDLTGIVNYIEDLQKTTDSLIKGINTGNVILDTILNDAILKYKEKGVSIKVSGMIPENFKLSNMDTTTIFSNAIINAAEATVKCKVSEKYVDIRIKNLKNKCIVEIKNPIEKPVVIVNNTIESTKKDRKNHGFGIMNIKKCLKNIRE